MDFDDLYQDNVGLFILTSLLVLAGITGLFYPLIGFWGLMFSVPTTIWWVAGCIKSVDSELYGVLVTSWDRITEIVDGEGFHFKPIPFCYYVFVPSNPQTSYTRLREIKSVDGELIRGDRVQITYNITNPERWVRTELLDNIKDQKHPNFPRCKALLEQALKLAYQDNITNKTMLWIFGPVLDRKTEEFKNLSEETKKFQIWENSETRKRMLERFTDDVQETFLNRLRATLGRAPSMGMPEIIEVANARNTIEITDFTLSDLELGAKEEVQKKITLVGDASNEVVQNLTKMFIEVGVEPDQAARHAVVFAREVVGKSGNNVLITEGGGGKKGK